MRNFMLVLSLLLLFVTPQTFTAQKQKVLVDKSHGQTHYTFTILQQYLDTDLNLQFEISEEPITIEKLSNVAVLFIPCPAQNTTFSDDELQAIKTFVNAGGGILITGESQYTYGGKNYTFGQPTTLNSILEALEIKDLVSFTGTNELGDEVMDEYENSGRSFEPVISSFPSHPIDSFLEGKKVIYYGCSIQVTDESIIFLRGGENTYSINIASQKTYEEGSRPPLGAALNVGSGRAVILGSTRIFSDSKTYGQATTRYIQYEQTYQLACNIFAWLTGEEMVEVSALTPKKPVKKPEENVIETAAKPEGEIKGKILVDAAHGEYFKPLPSKKMPQTPLSKWAGILAENGFQVDQLTQGYITSDLLANYDVLVIGEPQDILFSDDEIAAIHSFVNGGGGLLLGTSWYKYNQPDILNPISSVFGVKFRLDEIMDDTDNNGQSYYPLITNFASDEPLCSGISAIVYNGGSLEISGNAKAIAWGDDDSYALDASGVYTVRIGEKPVAVAVATYGQGRVVLTGGLTPYTDTNIDFKDDAKFAVNIISWLATGEVTEAKVPIMIPKELMVGLPMLAIGLILLYVLKKRGLAKAE